MLKRSLIYIILVSLFCEGLSAASVLFKVDMSHKIAQGVFNPAFDFVDIAGTFNGWGETSEVLGDGDDDLIYEVELQELEVGEQIEFKFRINGSWNGLEEFPGGGANRTYTVQEESVVLEYFYNDEIPDEAPAFSGFSSSVPSIFETGRVNFYENAQGNFESLHWIFEGGTPATSNEANPVIQYLSSGSFDVTLISSGPDGMDTLLVQDYITVAEQDKSELSWWNDEVFYEIFVRSFYDSDDDGIGDFAGLESKLDYLNDGDPNTSEDLGVGAIWLMPIHPSPSYHGYDVTDYRGINPAYGTTESFQSFLDAAHARGIKVIIDFVMNHSSDQHPWYVDSKSGSEAEKRDWYVWEDDFPGGSGPWGQGVWHSSGDSFYYGLFWGGMPDLNYKNTDLKSEMFDVADYWLNEVGIDGFRLDAVRYICEEDLNFDDVPQTIEFWKEYNSNIKELKEESFSVGEAWANTETVIDYVRDDALDACFEFDLSQALIDAINIRSSTNLKRQLQQAVDVYPYFQFASFISNHDQNRSFEVLGNNTGKSKIAASILLTMPGIPFMYYGEEIGMIGSKPDENIRRPMQWSSEQNGGFSNASPWINLNSNYQNYNVANQNEDSASLLSHYRNLIHLRNEHPSLTRGDYVAVESNSIRVLAFIRKLESETILVLQNLDLNPIENLSLDTSDALDLNGDYSATDLLTNESINLTIGANESCTISLTPRETKILLLNSNVESDLCSSVGSFSVGPNPSKDLLVISTGALDVNRIEVFNSAGQRLQSYSNGISEIDLSAFAEGQYLIRLEEVNGNVSVRKFIVQR